MMMPQSCRQLSTSAASHGELVQHTSFHSDILGNSRTVIVYLPPGYQADQDRRYPVLYMQDGQNLFDGRTSFIPGQHWHLNETADHLILEGKIEPLIIAGVYNAGEGRITEYTPTRDPHFKVGGNAEAYGRMLAEELKPFIDGQYRTLSGREHTGVGGSSLGGLVSLYLGFERPDVFSRIVAMSPSLWWNGCWMLEHFRQMESAPDVRVWLDTGTKEGARTHCNAAALGDLLAARGLAPDREFRYMEVPGGRHTELDWARRVDGVLGFLYGWKGFRPMGRTRAPHTCSS